MPLEVLWNWQDSQGKESFGDPDPGVRVREADQRRRRENLARVPTPTSGRREPLGFPHTDDAEKGHSFWGVVVDRRTVGTREIKPHGCEWMKNATRLEEEKAVKVVRNGEGGTKRDWNPATKFG